MFGSVVAGARYFYQATGLVTFRGNWETARAIRTGKWPGWISGSAPSARKAGAQFTCPGLASWSLVSKIAGQECVQLGSSGSFVAPVGRIGFVLQRSGFQGQQ